MVERCQVVDQGDDAGRTVGIPLVVPRPPVGRVIKRSRAWCQFSLQAMFIVVTLACLILGWLVHSLNWIEERRVFLEGTRWWVSYASPYDRKPPTIAPGLLWLLGERGVRVLNVDSHQADEGRRLFPEAEINASRW